MKHDIHFSSKRHDWVSAWAVEVWSGSELHSVSVCDRHLATSSHWDRCKMTDGIDTKLLMGALFVIVMLADDGMFSNGDKSFDEKKADAWLAWASSEHGEKLKDQGLAKSQFNEQSIRKWQRSVVSIGRHEPRVDEFNWIPHRTGFAVDSRLKLAPGRLVVSADVNAYSHVPNRFRIHGHPFSVPAPGFSHPAAVVGTGGLSVLRTTRTISILPVQIADWTQAKYDSRFPVVLIGFVNGQAAHFFTHSIGPSDRVSRIRLAHRPTGAFGEFFGAPVFNTDGRVVGVYSPVDRTPTYVNSIALRDHLDHL